MFREVLECIIDWFIVESLCGVFSVKESSGFEVSSLVVMNQRSFDHARSSISCSFRTTYWYTIIDLDF